MNIDEKLQKVKELEEAAMAIRAEVSAEYLAKYLPILKEHGTIYYNMGSFTVDIDAEFIQKFLEEQEETSWYHWGIKIADQVRLSGNDGKLDLYFEVSGTPPAMEEQKIKICKELGLKINFEAERKRLESDLIRTQRKLDKLGELDKRYNDN